MPKKKRAGGLFSKLRQSANRFGRTIEGKRNKPKPKHTDERA